MTVTEAETELGGRIVLTTAAVLLAFVVSVLLMSAYLFVEGTYGLPISNNIARIVSILAGVAILAFAPAPLKLRAIFALVFVPAMWMFLLWYSLMFAGVLFEDWL